MATSFTPITLLPPSSTTRNHRTRPSLAASASGHWWTPLFGWSSDPDSIQNSTTLTDESGPQIPDLDKRNQSRSRFTPGCLTEEKARQLRIKTAETENFHDVMYHSAIASRLASDVSGRFDRGIVVVATTGSGGNVWWWRQATVAAMSGGGVVVAATLANILDM